MAFSEPCQYKPTKGLKMKVMNFNILKISELLNSLAPDSKHSVSEMLPYCYNETIKDITVLMPMKKFMELLNEEQADVAQYMSGKAEDWAIPCSKSIKELKKAIRAIKPHPTYVMFGV